MHRNVLELYAYVAFSAMDYGKIALEAAKIGLNPTGYLLSQIAESTSKNVTPGESIADPELAALRVEAERPELSRPMKLKWKNSMTIRERLMLEGSLMKRGCLLVLEDQEDALASVSIVSEVIHNRSQMNS